MLLIVPIILWKCAHYSHCILHNSQINWHYHFLDILSFKRISNYTVILLFGLFSGLLQIFHASVKKIA